MFPLFFECTAKPCPVCFPKRAFLCAGRRSIKSAVSAFCRARQGDNPANAPCGIPFFHTRFIRLLWGPSIVVKRSPQNGISVLSHTWGVSLS